MKITSLDREIKKVFETAYYEVPRFQRPYSWEKDHIQEFWNDAIIDSETDYFIGSIVVFKKTDDILGIVDGQQRLTTITMILCAIRDAYNDEGFSSQAKGVHSLVERPDLDNTQNYVLKTETSYPYFQEYIQKFEEPEITPKFSPEETNLRNAFEQISLFIRDGIKIIKSDKTLDVEKTKLNIGLYLNEIRDKVLKLKVIYIELDDEDDAYIIFETLNTRGKDLGVSDLIKNFLTKNIKARTKNVDLAKDKWNDIRIRIDSVSGAISGSEIDLDTFLVHFWLSEYGYISKKALFKKFKSTVKPNQAKAFLDNLVVESTAYQTILKPESKVWDKNDSAIKESLNALQDLRVVQQIPMVLSILRNYREGNIKNSQAREMLHSIEHFHYVFNSITAQRSSGGISSMYSLYARKLNEVADSNELGILIKEFRHRLREKLPSYDEFVVNFKSLQYTNESVKWRKIIRYTLSKIDKEFNVTGASINYADMTIEHLMPQSKMKRFDNGDDYIGMIGNLILLNEKANNKLGVKDFASKKSALLSCNIYLDTILKNAIHWGQKEIESRTEELASLAYKKVFKV